MSFCIRVAGHTVLIHHRYPLIRAISEAYMIPLDDVSDSVSSAPATETTCLPHFSIFVTDNDLEYEQKQCSHPLSDAYAECLAIHRKLSQALVRHGILLIHSAAVAVDGEAYIFIAPSGVGKSTHVAQWLTHFGDRAIVVNGDKPYYGFDGHILRVYGTPWCGKEGWGANITMPVKAFCLVERGTTNAVVPMNTRDAVEALFGQVLMPEDPESSPVFMAVLDRIIHKIPFYRMQCTISAEAAVVAYRAMSEKE